MISTLSRAFLDQDNMSSDSASAIASQQSIKAYVDDHIKNYLLLDGTEKMTGDLDMDENEIDAVEKISFSTGGTGYGSIHGRLDEDDMVSDDNNSAASQQSIKAYVDTNVGKVSGWNNGYDHIMVTPADWVPSDGSSTYNAAIYDFGSNFTYGA